MLGLKLINFIKWGPGGLMTMVSDHFVRYTYEILSFLQPKDKKNKINKFWILNFKPETIHDYEK